MQEADEAVHLGTATYLDPHDGHRKSATSTKRPVVDALVTPPATPSGWAGGFVSERASFAQRCEAAGLVFVGPDSAADRALGDKVTAKQLAERARRARYPVEWRPGRQSRRGGHAAATLGYPVVMKATAGGGGRGIRVVRTRGRAARALASARSESALAFGDPAVFVERLVPAARHVEVQVIADHHGTVWAVGVRDCSLQRRHQKVIEEAGSTALDSATEAAIKAAAVRLATAVGYRSAGTVEFLVDPETRQFLFMEVNTRLQVEHPVTEATTGLDLVELQLHVAVGGALEGGAPGERTRPGGPVVRRGPRSGVRAGPGRIAMLRLSAGSGVRVDSGVREGDMIPADFDSMVAKIIAGAGTGTRRSRGCGGCWPRAPS